MTIIANGYKVHAHVCMFCACAYAHVHAWPWVYNNIGCLYTLKLIASYKRELNFSSPLVRLQL